MSKNDQPINTNKKVTAYIDNLFSGVGASQQLFDLKEELVTNLKEKIIDIKSRGLDDEQAFKEAVISMGDLGGLVDDMRRIGQDTAKQRVYSSMTARISNAGIVAGVLLILFGMFTVTMLYFMKMEAEPVIGSSIFIVAGGAMLTYSILVRETRNKYGMNKIRAALYALSVGLILFSIFTAFVSRFATGEIFIAIGSLMVFSLPGIGLFLLLILTGTDRRK
ncbi:MAG: permease prefix domain 1-containing protein [Syntrophomonas sp.]|nr:permease prefix domain 1-containing protein [Syntrophomonas sp.]